MGEGIRAGLLARFTGMYDLVRVYYNALGAFGCPVHYW